LLEQLLLILGASIFAVLGAIHLAYTFFSRKFHAFDRNVTVAMKSTSPRLTSETTMWKAWVGFNASHSLGALLVAAFYIPLAATHMDIVRESPWFAVLPAVVGLSYLALARAYWFKVPFAGILVATLCFLGSALSVFL